MDSQEKKREFVPFKLLADRQFNSGKDSWRQMKSLLYIPFIASEMIWWNVS